MSSEGHCRIILAEIEAASVSGRSLRLFNDDAMGGLASGCG